MRSLLFLGLWLYLRAPGSGRALADPPNPSYVPQETKVVVLPVVNKAFEFNKDFEAKIQENALKKVTEAFSHCGFQVIEQKAIATCLTEIKLDLNDRENWRTPNFINVGKRLQARLVVFCIVLDAHTKTNSGTLDPFGTGSKEGIANVRAYLIDTQTGEAILDKKQAEGKNTGGILAGIDSGMSRESKAVVKGIDKVLKSFLSAYSVTTKTKESN